MRHIELAAAVEAGIEHIAKFWEPVGYGVVTSYRFPHHLPGITVDA